MKDAEYEREKTRLQLLAAKWIKPLGLAWWTIHFLYDDDPIAFRKAWGKETSEDAVARTLADWRYGEATIRWNMQRLVDTAFEDDALELMFVHELMHVFVNEMRWDCSEHDGNYDHEERVCTTLAKGIIWLRDSLTEASLDKDV